VVPPVSLPDANEPSPAPEVGPRKEGDLLVGCLQHVHIVTRGA